MIRELPAPLKTARGQDKDTVEQNPLATMNEVDDHLPSAAVFTKRVDATFSSVLLPVTILIFVSIVLIKIAFIIASRLVSAHFILFLLLLLAILLLLLQKRKDRGERGGKGANEKVYLFLFLITYTNTAYSYI